MLSIAHPFAQAAAGAPESVTTAFDQTEAMFRDLIVDNLPAIIAVFTFFLAVRFGPALISWYRHRNDPKQLPGF